MTVEERIQQTLGQLVFSQILLQQQIATLQAENVAIKNGKSEPGVSAP